MTTFHERWIIWRNRRLGDPAFQRWAAKFPLTRPVARRRARALFDIVAGFTYSQVAYAVIEVGLLPFVEGAKRSLAEVAAHTGLPPVGAERLLKAAIALDLIEAAGGGYLLGSAGAAMLGNPGVPEMIAHHRYLYADLADPVALLRGGAGLLAAYWPYSAASDERTAAYSALMAASQPMLAGQILDAYPLSGHKRLLDIGGGAGVFLRAAGARFPALRLTLFDLPAVAARLADPAIDAVGGSFVDDPLPAEADVISLVRVLHDHDDAVVAALLAKVHAVLPSGGTVLVAEPMAETPGAAPIGDAYFGMYLLAMGSGRPRSAVVLRAMLDVAGFSEVREHATAIPMLVRVLTATR
ncbi:methyltransferase domain-containing protein [Polymorphobacter sp. PAMC 29334]|uniref:methyltransferase n=1 Tax=Polymorphobacter sp. PAMC 29334 TaxID=2862331 RepID=UPI001C742C3D|nr:methyltransferase [Polymorphobacter sp. PAMC 29334]QYE34752.1 methyltransferase domain-containing protein [Polymorphobacter sp. PAMC 29334]